eukprot:359074-Chlamydomonas_euryale.AAC.2
MGLQGVRSGNGLPQHSRTKQLICRFKGCTRAAYGEWLAQQPAALIIVVEELTILLVCEVGSNRLQASMPVWTTVRLHYAPLTYTALSSNTSYLAPGGGPTSGLFVLTIGLAVHG